MGARARGEHVAVVVVTNGDFTCERDGHVRERETVAALGTLGVAEEDIHFLGYPDGWLAEMGDEPLPPVDRRALDGSCVKATGTYGEHGAAGRDEHTARTGSPGAYVAASLEEDLAALLGRLHPHDVYVTHPLDTHPDHAATYAYVRRALDRLGRTPPRLHRAVVHAGACWPNGRGRWEPCPPIVTHDLTSPLPRLPDPYESYAPTEHVNVPDAARKLGAISRYGSQLGADPDHDWLTTFARADEAFWPEELTCEGARCERRHETAARVSLSPQAPSGKARSYDLRLDKDGETLIVMRPDHVLGHWTLPLAGRDRAHVFEVTFSTYEGEHATEVSVWRDGAFLGVGIEVSVGGGPPSVGPPGADVEEGT